MIYILCGLGGFFFSALLLIGGMVVGWKARERYDRDRRPTPEELGQKERDRLIADQAAFRDLMGYTVETAYGVEPPDMNGEED